MRLPKKRTLSIVAGCTVLFLLVLNSFALLRALTQSYIYPEEFNYPYSTVAAAVEELVLGVEPADLGLVHPNDIIPSSHESERSQSHDSSMESPYRYVSNDSTEKNPPVRDPLCGGCRIAVAQKNQTCGSEINQRMAEQEQMNVSASVSKSLVDVAIMVAEKYPSSCARCHPNACSEADKMYWRIDEGAPRVNKGWTHRVDSIPLKHRIPESFIGDLKGFFSNSSNTVEKRQYYFEYNPSIVVLPADQIPDIPGESAVYLASYRIAETQMCMTDEQKKLANPTDHPIPNDFLAIAFLRDNLTKIQDFVLDLGTANYDFRLFTLKDQLYLTGTNSITPIWVNLPKDMSERKRKKHIIIMYDMFQKDQSGPSLAVRNFASCCTSQTCKGKNFNYFVGANDTILVETNPVFPHTVDELDLKTRCRDAQVVQQLMKENDTSISTSTGPEYPSFHSNMERSFAIRGEINIGPTHRGTACCGKIQVPDERSGKLKDLLVGISHQKYAKRSWSSTKVNYTDKSYLSALYAFDPAPPYRIVARSGSFCFGYPDKEEAKENYYANLTLARNLIMGEPENCPFITFVSGITEKAGDPSKVIIGYGINDCISRFVEVDKSELVRLLFHPTGAFDDTAPL
jgi:hypothetical protein